MTTKIASWNVNSIRARLPNVLAWLEEAAPDIVMLQELKAQDDQFPAEALEDLGYHCYVFGQKSWNGVAILSKIPVDNPETDILKGLPGDDTDEQSRYIEAVIDGIRYCCLYLPNGNPVDTEKYPYKLAWMDRLYQRSQDLLASGDKFVLGGDFNIIPANEDCYNPVAWEDDALFRLDSRKKFRALLHLGLTDAFRIENAILPEAYTFWDYQGGAWPKNHGIRIDHFLMSPHITDMMQKCSIDKAPRDKEKASDHTPIILEISA